MQIPAISPKANALNTSPHSSADPQGKSAKPAEVEQPAISSNASPEEKRQTALRILNNLLTKAYEKIGSHGQSSATADYTAFEPLTAEKAANNILGFIERRLTQDAADGATQEQLKARLEAGLSGFEKGFGDAKEQLKALELLSPEVDTDIAKTHDLVLKGIDALRAKFITDSSATPDSATTDNTAPVTKINSSTPASTPATLAPPNPLAASTPLAATSGLASSSYEYGRAREFSFQLQTKEGDTVTINARSSEGLAYQTAQDGSSKTTNASYSASQSMSWEVSGNLNEDEMKSINELLNRVDHLAQKFFDGNLDSAFAQAKNLGYDDTQIGSFSLNLAQADIQQVTQAYKVFEPAPPSDATAPLSEQLLPLGHFMRDLLDSLKQAAEFPDPVKLLRDMAKAMTDNGEQGQRLQDFIGKLAAPDTSAS